MGQAERGPERILLVDDNGENRQILAAALEDPDYTLFMASSGEEALLTVQEVKPSLIMLDVRMPGGIDGFEVCRRLKWDPETRDTVVIFLTGPEEEGRKVEGFQVGAVDFVAKPFEVEEVRIRVKSQVAMLRLRRQLERANGALQRELRVAGDLLMEANSRAAGPLLGESAAVQTLRAEIQRFAGVQTPLLLTGPPGSGQEATARAIHQGSSRAARPFIFMDCATLGVVGTDEFVARSGLTDPMLESGQWKNLLAREGYEDKMMLADGGTLFLEHLEKLPGNLQRTLADFLLRNERDVAAGQAPAHDVRIIAYVSLPLKDAVEVYGFSSRLAELVERDELALPPLSERLDDIPTLVEFFMRQQARRLGLVVNRVEPESMARLKEYDWPGNILEMQNLIQRQVALTRGSVLSIAPRLLQGVALGGYQLLDKLGEGGMGEVWRAKHHLLAHPAAVKLIRLNPTHPPEQQERNRRRFMREARVTANLRARNTVHLYDFGIDERAGTYYYVMELLHGIDLGLMIDQFGAVEPARAIHLLCQACRSLVEAHKAGLVHRDIKPANLYVCRFGVEIDILKVLDFGIVKELFSGEHLSGEGEAHLVVGTPGFMSPEVIMGSPDVDWRADLYSIGCVAYLMLAGRPVFFGELEVEVMRHLHEAPPPLAQAAKGGLPTRLEQVVMACLEKHPADRPANAAELLHELETISLERPWTVELAQAWWRERMGYDPDPTPPPMGSLDYYDEFEVSPVDNPSRLDTTLPQKPKA